MAKKTSPLLPGSVALLEALGERLRLARLRRRLTAKQLAERAGMVPMTLRAVERGRSGVTIGAYVAVMQVLGIESELALLAATDAVGRELQDSRLRATPRPPVATPPPPRSPSRRSTPPSTEGFVTAEALAALVVPSRGQPKPR